MMAGGDREIMDFDEIEIVTSTVAHDGQLVLERANDLLGGQVQLASIRDCKFIIGIHKIECNFETRSVTVLADDNEVRFWWVKENALY